MPKYYDALGRLKQDISGTPRKCWNDEMYYIDTVSPDVAIVVPTATDIVTAGTENVSGELVSVSVSGFNNTFNEEFYLELEINRVRNTRDSKLAEVDYIFVRQNEELTLIDEGIITTTTIPTSAYIEFLEYKKELRDLPDTITSFEDLNSLTWPTKPSGG